MVVRELAERVRRRHREKRGGFMFLITLIAALILLGVLMKFGAPSLFASKSTGIRQSLLSDAQAAVNAELLLASQAGQYEDASLDNSAGQDPVRKAIDANYPDITLVASPGNSVTVSTYPDATTGKPCFTVTVTNSQLTNVEAYYDSCDNTHAAPYLQPTS